MHQQNKFGGKLKLASGISQYFLTRLYVWRTVFFLFIGFCLKPKISWDDPTTKGNNAHYYYYYYYYY